MHTKFADIAFPVEDQFAAMPVHPEIFGIRPADDAEHEGARQTKGAIAANITQFMAEPAISMKPSLRVMTQPSPPKKIEDAF